MDALNSRAKAETAATSLFVEHDADPSVAITIRNSDRRPN